MYRKIEYGFNRSEIRKLMHEILKLRQKQRHHQKKLAEIEAQIHKVEECMDSYENPIAFGEG